MTTFTAGSNGANVLNILTAGSISRQTVSSTELDTYLSSGQKTVFYGSFSVNSSGTTISGGTISGWSLFGANGQLSWSITGAHADVQTIVADSQLGLNDAVTAMFLPAGTTYIGSSNPSASDFLIGVGGGDTYIGGAASETYETAGGINTITGGTGSNTVQFASSFSNYSFTWNGGDSLTVTDSVSTRNGTDRITGVQTLKFTDLTVTVGSDGHLHLPTTTASQAVAWSSKGDIAPINISDSSSNVVNQLDSLETMVKAGTLGGIALTNSGVVTLNLTAAQITNDAAALKLITTPVTIDVSAAAANTSFSGTGNPGTVVVFSGKASQYQIFATGNGGVTVVDSGTGRTSADHFANVTALQFSDQTDFVANAPASSGATTGNITELYSAAFGRQPDVAGLAYYQQQLANNPSIPLTTFAQNFLASPEYKNNASHNYAQGTSGDTAFIDDLYTNLLHRAPESGAVPYYLDLISKITAGTTQGTAAYTTALATAHAVVLTDVSQSPEFVGNVQVTGQSSTAGHWLILS